MTGCYLRRRGRAQQWNGSHSIWTASASRTHRGQADRVDPQLASTEAGPAEFDIGDTCPIRVLAIGDIHGCFRALSTLAESVPIGHDDHLIGLGDYVDRGPACRAVIDWLIKRSGGGRLVALRGNLEVMMLARAPRPTQASRLDLLR